MELQQLGELKEEEPPELEKMRTLVLTEFEESIRGRGQTVL
jgi:hypothetical protein